MARTVVLGAGFAGLWAALGAARKRDEIGAPAADVEILVVDRNPYHNIRTWGALHTVGWDRQLYTSGAPAKVTKQVINQQRIYPPRNGARADILAAAAPTVQKPPPVARR